MSAELPILMFHDIDERRSVLSVAPGVWQRGLTNVYERGHHALTFRQIVDVLRSGAPLPDRTLGITFDDGYGSVYGEAFPVLQCFGMTATVFITVGREGTIMDGGRLPSRDGRPMLSWSEIREMGSYGIEFGAHTLTHPDLTRLDTGDARDEILASKAIIENALGSPVVSFAYPYGRCNDRIRSIVAEHFSGACTDTLDLITASSDPYALPRVDAYYLRTDRLFRLILTRFFPGYVRMRAVPRRMRRMFRRSSPARTCVGRRD